MSLAAASLSEGAAEPSSTGSEDSLVINPTQVCARSYDSIDSLCPNVRPYINNSRQSLDSMGSYESLPRCYSIPNSENPNKVETLSPGRFNTWSKSTWKKKYPFIARSENNLLDLSSHKLRNAFRRTIRLNSLTGKTSRGTASFSVHNMNGKEKKSPARQFHSLDGLDTIGDLMSESKTVTAVVSKGVPDHNTPCTPLSYCTTNSLHYPESLTSSSDSLFIGHKQDFRSICWSQQRRKSGISYVTGTTDELCLSGTAEELRFEETEQVHMNMRAPRTGRRLSDIGLFKEVTVKVKVPASILCSKKGFGKEILFTLAPTVKLYHLIAEIEKFTNVPLMKYKLCPGLVLQDCLEFWRSEEDLNLSKELQLCTAMEEAPTLHFRVISKETSDREVKVAIALPPMVITASYKTDSTTADLLSTIINSPKLKETNIKRNMQKFGLYHPKYKVFLRTDELVSFYNINTSDVLELKTRTQGVGGQSLYLHVQIPDENRTVLVVINSDASVSDLISKILLEVESRDDSKWNYYGIYLPSNEERQGGWMDDYKMLHSYSLKSVDKVELRARFRMFIFDLQVYSTSQQYTRHFVNMYISDKITAGEVLRIITSTNCLDYPTSWYGIYLHDNERIPDNVKLCAALEDKGTSKQDSLVVHMIHQPLHVSLEGEEDTAHTFMVDFSMPIQQLHAIFCRYYGIRVPAACTLEHNETTLDLSMCAIKNKISPGSSITIKFKRIVSPSPGAERSSIIMGRGRAKKRNESTDSDMNSVRSYSDCSGSETNTPIMSPFSPRPTESPKLNLIDKILAETVTKGEVTSYESTNGVELNGSGTEPDIGGLVIRDEATSPAQEPTTPVSPTSPTSSLSPTSSPSRRFDPPEPEPVILRKPVERVKRAQSKIYEEDDINIWDDDSKVEETLIKESNGQIKSGTFNRFVELLTDTRSYQINFVKVFLLTYQAFTTPKQLLRKLVQRYNVPRDPSMSMEEFVKYRTGIQNGVINCLKLWVTNGDDFENNPHLQKEFMQFIHTCVSHDNPQQYRILRQKLLVVRGMVTVPVAKKEDVNTPPLKLPPNLSPNATLFDHGPPEIARQLTMLDFALFTKIKPIELVNQAWVKPKYSHQAKNILHFAERMNTLTRWAATSILAQKDKGGRAKLITDFIYIADELYKLNNFSSFIAIINALEGSAISRLHASWNKVDRKACQRNDELYEIILPNSNFRNLRKEVSQANPPCIPYVGLFMSDLTFATECNPTVVNGMINFLKCTYINDIINRLRLYQHTPYHFESVPSIVTPLQQLHALDEETLYEMSLQIEPKKPK